MTFAPKTKIYNDQTPPIGHIGHNNTRANSKMNRRESNISPQLYDPNMNASFYNSTIASKGGGTLNGVNHRMTFLNSIDHNTGA